MVIFSGKPSETGPNAGKLNIIQSLFLNNNKRQQPHPKTYTVDPDTFLYDLDIPDRGTSKTPSTIDEMLKHAQQSAREQPEFVRKVLGLLEHINFHQ